MAPASFPVSILDELATSIDQLSNYPGAVRHHIQSAAAHGARENAMTWKSILFVIYQTGRYGPQNSFRLCLVHEGFDTESDMSEAEKKIEQDTQEFIVLGPKPPRIEDPREDLLEDLSDVEQGPPSNSSLASA